MSKETMGGGQTITIDNTTIIPRDELEVILNISGGGNVTLADGLDMMMNVSLANENSNDVSVSYKGSNGNTTITLAQNDEVKLGWTGTFWNYESIPILGIDDNKEAFAFNVDAMMKAGETAYITGKDENGVSFEYGIENLITKCEEESYSTTEVKTNKTWIDGKPIYRKVISFTFDGSNTTIQKSVGLNNVQVIKIDGGVSLASSGNVGAFFPLVFYWATDNYVSAYIGGEGKLVVRSTNTSTYNRTGYAIIYYIKL